jgi:hypothetical protein
MYPPSYLRGKHQVLFSVPFPGIVGQQSRHSFGFGATSDSCPFSLQWGHSHRI